MSTERAGIATTKGFPTLEEAERQIASCVPCEAMYARGAVAARERGFADLSAWYTAGSPEPSVFGPGDNLCKACTDAVYVLEMDEWEAEARSLGYASIEERIKAESRRD